MSGVRRRSFLLFAGMIFAAPRYAIAQQAPNARRIGILSVRSRPTPQNPELFAVFVQSMRELGYVEGKNIVIEWRFADGNYERLPELAADLIQLNPEVIVTHTTPSTEALRRATSTIPIVNVSMGDPLGTGFAASLAHPGGNITGLSLMNVDLAPKQIEMLKVVVPGISRAAVLVNPGTSIHASQLETLQTAAKPLGLTIIPVSAGTPEEIDGGFVTMSRERVGGVIVLGDGFFTGQARHIADSALRYRVASFFNFREDVVAGGLASYGHNRPDFYRRAATYVDKILKGAKAGDLPIEQPLQLHFAINLKTAKALSLEISKELRARADELIE